MRKAFRRRVWGLSTLGGFLTGVVVLLAAFAQRFVSVFEKLEHRNQLTLATISCRETVGTGADQLTGTQICDLRKLEEDPRAEAASADYVLDLQTRYFIYNDNVHWPNFKLNFSDVSFIRGFREPKTVTFETGERWRLYSAPAEVDGKSVEVIVGGFEFAPWIVGESTQSDEQLKDEAKAIIRQLKRGKITSPTDWQVVDADTGRITDTSGDVPAFYPKDMELTPGPFHFEDGEVWLVRGARNERLAAVSLESLGSPYAFALFGVGAFVFGSLGAYPIAKKFQRVGVTSPMPLDEALRTGETEFVEFKQEIKERQQMLKDVAAFANSNGGTIFIGVVDGTLETVGIDGATLEKKDAYERGLRDSIRHSIQPSPDVVIDFLRKNDRVVARIFVAASPQCHSFEGRYYVREGSQSRYLIDGEIGDL